MKYDLSILVPTFNQENFIILCLDSIQKNIKINKISVEVLIGNDCSQDQTGSVVEAFINNNKLNNFRLFNYLENKGGLKNIDYLLSNAKGRFILIIEGDDELIESNFISNAIKILDKKEHSLCASKNLIKVDEQLINNRYIPYKKNSEIKFNDLIFGNFFQLSSIVFKKSLFKKMPKYFFTLRMGDWPLYLNLLHHKNGYFLNQNSSIYRVHSSGVWSKNRATIKIQDTSITLNNLRMFLFKNKQFLYVCSQAYLFGKYLFYKKTFYIKKDNELKQLFENTFYLYPVFLLFLFFSLSIIMTNKLRFVVKSRI